MPDTTRHPSAASVRSQGAVPTSASHLSIGEVLGILLEEFPDVTISKIRFLESQGLIEPERTPSGYRKFFEPDVELLRLILREQRENFLPLRVIKDRIDAGEIGKDEAPSSAPRGIRNVSTAGVAGDPLLPGISAEPPVTPTDEPSHAATPATPATPDDPSPAPAAAARRPAKRRGGARDADAATAVDDETPPEPEPATEQSTDEDAPRDAVAEDDVPPAAADAAVPPEPEAEPAPEPQPEPEAAPAAAAAPARNDEVDDRELLSAQEMAARANTTPSTIDDLRSYGLIHATESLGESYYDEDAVQIAGICARFIEVGVDVRHLRGWKTSADRESSVYEGLTLPLLRQRNPQGRRVARDRLLELNELGASLRRALMEAAMRPHLGPGH